MVLDTDIINISQMLKKDNLVIPEYQRPYKWDEKNVNPLIDDIIEQCHENSFVKYRLGTIVYHQYKKYKDDKDKDEDNKLYIVDGQQRTLTIALIALAITKNHPEKIEAIKNKYPELTGSAFKSNSTFLITNNLSMKNLVANYAKLEKRIINEFDEHIILFFYFQCEIVTYTLDDVSEAFQFFDSQNSRGKDLEPHDLLKAFHLREMYDLPEEERNECILLWEKKSTKKLAELFSLYLFRIKNWSRGNPARIFTKNDIEVFKGINFNRNNYSFSKVYRVAHYYLENYNLDYNRNIDKNKMRYPFQIDQPVINGKRFFEMIDYYFCFLDNLLNDEALKYNKNGIISLLNDYPARNRTGDKYIRNLFDCALLYFVDKFDNDNPDITSRAIVLFFIWAYSLRIKNRSVYIESIDNYAHSDVKIFRIIHDAMNPFDVINIVLQNIKRSDEKASKIDQIIEKFKELGYYEGKN